MYIAFYLFYKPKKEFHKTLFAQWNDWNPLFTNTKAKAKRYTSEQEAQEDIDWLWKAVSNKAITLNIKVEK
ncbi:MAG: hypothetical protein L0L22_14420 [Staphylococcus equorum]|nr:hypothetical protein [Tetragenococcus koreensis]MDN6572179.1 hypothetical protein [Staphylococcus equorum]MDN6750931.1 hypothetical protein [Staphylococcus equorum]